MSSEGLNIDGLVIKAREYDGQQLLHCCLASSIRSIDVKEGSWNGMLVSVGDPVFSQISVYGEGTTSYCDELGSRVVIIAGEKVDEGDKVHQIYRISRNELLLSVPASLSIPTVPFWFSNQPKAGKLQSQSMKIRFAIQWISETCDYRAHLSFQQWFYEMHDKILPLKDESYSDIWKNELAVANSTKIQNGCWLPASSEELRCVLQINSVRDGLVDATAHYLGMSGSLLSVGNELVRSVHWDDQNLKVRVGAIEGHI